MRSRCGIETGTFFFSYRLNKQHSQTYSIQELVLLAMRCLNHIWTAYPRSQSIAVEYGAIGKFCEKMKGIEFIDIAEETLRGLLKLSDGHANEIIRAGGIVIVMTYMDFFRMNTQRVVMRVVEALCRGLNSESVSSATPMMSRLLNLMKSSDDTLASKACESIYYIIRASAKDMESFFNNDSNKDTLSCFFAVLENEQDEQVKKLVPSVLKSLIVICEFSSLDIVSKKIVGRVSLFSRLLEVNCKNKDINIIRHVLELFDCLFKRRHDRDESEPPAKKRKRQNSSPIHDHFSNHVLTLLLELFERLHSQRSSSNLGVTKSLVNTVHRFVATSCPDHLTSLKCSARFTQMVSTAIWIGPCEVLISSLNILRLLLNSASSVFLAHARRCGLEEDVRVLSSMSRRSSFSRRKSRSSLATMVFEMTKNSDASRKSIVDQSRDIYYRHFRSRNVSSSSPQMLKLSDLSRRAMSGNNDIDNMLIEFRDMIRKGVTSYELSQSGAVRALAHILNTFPQNFMSCFQDKSMNSLLTCLHSIIAKQVSLENCGDTLESSSSNTHVGSTFLRYACRPIRLRLRPVDQSKNDNGTIVTTVKATTSLDRLAYIVRQELTRKDSLARPAGLTRKRSWSMQNNRKKIDMEEKNKRSRSISSSSSTSASPRREFSENIMQWFGGSSTRRRQRSFSLDDKRYYQEEENDESANIRFHLMTTKEKNKILAPLPEVISLFQVLYDGDYFLSDDDDEKIFDLCYSVAGEFKGSRGLSLSKTITTTSGAKDDDDDVVNLLCMIRRHTVVRNLNFVNHHIDSILSSLLDMPWIGVLPVSRLPEWCDSMIRSSPFLFSTKTRLKFLRYLRSGLARCVQQTRHRFLNSNTNNNTFENDRNKDIWDAISAIVPTVCFKMTVDRTCLIENACSAFEKMSELRSGLSSMGPPALEVEFLNEVGTGT